MNQQKVNQYSQHTLNFRVFTIHLRDQLKLEKHFKEYDKNL